MAKAKKGEYLSCKVCGLVVVVDEACGCSATEILCCKKPMAKGRKPPVAKKKPATKAAKAPVKTSAKAAAKAAPAKVNAKTPAKTVAKAKPAAKKPTRTKK